MAKGKAKAKAKAPKRKLSKTPEAKRARARRAEAKAAAEAAAKKKATAARRRVASKRERESAAEGEREAKRAAKAKRARRERGETDEREDLGDVLDTMRNKSPIPITLRLTEAEPGARVPWTIVGRFDPMRRIGYKQLYALFASWRDDLFVEAAVHPQRFAQIRIVYNDPNAKRGEGDSIVSHSGAWEAVISEAAQELDPDDEDSLTNRYSETRIGQFYVYFSGQLASSVDFSL